MSQRELRFIQATELRAETDGDKQYLTGYAARYDTLSRDLGGWQERIKPGAFTRALKEKQDVRKLINHDPNLVLGRTKSKTLELSEDNKGLKFRCLMPDTSYARDLMESVNRGDINECSFAFSVHNDGERAGQSWTDADDEGADSMYSPRCIRELHDLDLYDVSTVTYPAYPGTSSEMSLRSLFPEGMPAEVREQLRAKKTKKVDGEELTADKFAFVGDPEDTSTWKLPIHDANHAKNALARFNQTEGIPADEKQKVYDRIVAACKKFGIHVSDEEEKSWKLRAEMRLKLTEVS